MPLDLRTAFLSAAGFMAVVTLLLVVFRLTRKTYDGFGHWTSASALVVLGFVLYGLRELAPDLLSFVGGSAAFAAAAVARLSGAHQFLGLPRMSRVWWAAPAAVVVGQLLLGFGPERFAERAALVSTAVALPALATAIRFVRAPATERLLHRATAGLLFGVVALLVLRAATAPHLTPSLLSSTPGQTALLLGTALLECAWNLTFLMLNSSRLESELRRAIEDVRILEKLLPICAWCKKIRDDGGYWQQIETFLGEHANTRFTHGICPDCERKLRG